jgi:hypothetical protein
MALNGSLSPLALGGDTNLPQVQVEAITSTVGEEGQGTAGFRVARSGGNPTSDLTVHYRVGGTAANGVDYQGLAGKVTLRAGESSATIQVLPIDDAEVEPDETVEVRLCPGNEPFTLALLPDTQYYVLRGGAGTPDMFFAQTRWIATNRDVENIVFVLHEGDVTDRNTEGEWLRGRAAMRMLDGVVPYAIAPGNHDGLGQRSNLTERFNRHFPAADYQSLPTFGGVFEHGKLDNSYHFFSAGGVDWMVLVLEFGPRDVVLAWANELVGAHPERRVIVLTHAHLYPDDTLQGAPEHLGSPTSYGRQNNGTHVWEKLLRRHANISLVFNGHSVILPSPETPGLEDETGRLVGLGDSGNRVYQIAADYQSSALGGGGFLRVVRFFPSRDAMSVQTYSPYLGRYLTDDANQFGYDQLGLFTSANENYEIDPGRAAAVVTLVSHDEDPTALAIDRIFAYGQPPEIEVTFSRPVEAASAEDPSHYFIEGDLSVARATLLGDARRVRLKVVGALTSDATYRLLVHGVKDLAAEPNTLTNAQRSFGYSPVLLSEDFNSGLTADWTVVDEGAIAAPSSWSVWEGALVQFANLLGPRGGITAGRKGTFAYWNPRGALSWSNYVMTARLNPADDDGLGLLFRYQDRSNYYKLELDRALDLRNLTKLVGGRETLIASTSGGYPIETNVTLQVVVNRNQITVAVDGRPLFGGAVTDDGLSVGTVALYAWASAGVAFEDIFVRPLPLGTPLDVFRPAPSPRLVSPPDGVGLVSPASFALSAEIDDHPDRIREVKFFRNAELLGTVLRPPFSLLCSNLLPQDSTFSLQARDDLGLVGLSPPVHVHVAWAPEVPVFAVQPRSRLAMPHTAIDLIVRANGTWPLSYQWFHDGAPMLGATNVLLALGDLQSSDQGVYWAQARNLAGTAESLRATVGLVPPGGLGILSEWLPAERQIEITVVGDAGGNVRLERSLNLREWAPWAVTNGFTGTWQVQWGAGSLGSGEFFRAARH